MDIADKLWIEKCRTDSYYKILVDNDCLFVVDNKGEHVHSFSEYGYYFAKELLEYLGCEVEFV